MKNRKFLLPLAASVGALLTGATSQAATTPSTITVATGTNPASVAPTSEGFVLSRASESGVQLAQEDTGHSSHSSHASHSSHSSHVSGS
jgi:hypothetical protein